MVKYMRQPCPYTTVCVLVCICFLLASCDNTDPASRLDMEDRIDESAAGSLSDTPNTDQILFGFDLRSSPQEDAKQYLPLMKYLEAETGHRFMIRFTPSTSSIVDDLGNNVVQFAAVGAVSFLEADEKYGVKPLVRGLNLQGKSEYQSMFVVLPGSPIRAFSDIRGKRLVFGNRSSTQGNLIPRIVLAEKGVGLDQLASYQYTASHQDCANTVLSGKADVCGMQDTMALSLARKGLLRILHTSGYYPSSGIAVNREVSPELIEKVRQALLDFKPQGEDKTDLYHWDKTEMPLGFKEAESRDYDQLKHWFKKLSPPEPPAVSKNK